MAVPERDNDFSEFLQSFPGWDTDNSPSSLTLTDAFQSPHPVATPHSAATPRLTSSTNYPNEPFTQIYHQNPSYFSHNRRSYTVPTPIEQDTPVTPNNASPAFNPYGLPNSQNDGRMMYGATIQQNMPPIPPSMPPVQQNIATMQHNLASVPSNRDQLSPNRVKTMQIGTFSGNSVSTPYTAPLPSEFSENSTPSTSQSLRPTVLPATNYRNGRPSDPHTPSQKYPSIQTQCKLAIHLKPLSCIFKWNWVNICEDSPENEDLVAIIRRCLDADKVRIKKPQELISIMKDTLNGEQQDKVLDIRRKLMRQRNRQSKPKPGGHSPS